VWLAPRLHGRSWSRIVARSRDAPCSGSSLFSGGNSDGETNGRDAVIGPSR
jgi:hypothetical protein